MRRQYTWKEVLVVFAFYMAPSAIAFGLVVSVPATLVVVGATVATLLRRASTERWVEGLRTRLRYGF